MCDIDYITVGQVNDAKTLARYIEQQTGTPWATNQDMILLKKKCKDFFKRYPQCDYTTLCHVADWCHRKRRRYSNVWKVVDAFRYAYEDGALPEVDQPRQDVDLNNRINEAISVETDELWRTRLIGTRGNEARRELLRHWLQTREPQLVQVQTGTLFSSL